jgi:hypothetical protein
MKKQHIYLKFNLLTFLNDRVYTTFLVFYKSIQVLKRDLHFYKLWTYVKSELVTKDLYLEAFFQKFPTKFN